MNIISNKDKTEIFKSSEHINEKGNVSYRGFGFLSLFSDPIDLPKRITVILQLSAATSKQRRIIQMEPHI